MGSCSDASARILYLALKWGIGNVEGEQKGSDSRVGLG